MISTALLWNCVGALLYLLKFFLLSTCASAENLHIPKIKGISLEMKSFYNPLQNFECLDGSSKLSFSRVNDDYCDCPDASDEPGTAACAEGHFHCINLMHSPLDIPSSRVNDGICDCCDGSDEYSSGVSCPNSCEELGRVAREAAKRREELLSRGGQLRKAMIDQGKLKVNEAKHKISELKRLMEQAKNLRDEKEQIRKEKEEVERKLLDSEDQKKSNRSEASDTAEFESESFADVDKQQAEEAFQDLDTNEDGVVTFAEISAQKRFDQDRNGLVSDDEAKFFLAYHDEVDADEFLAVAWPLIKPVWLLDPFKGSSNPSIDISSGQAADMTQKTLFKEKSEDDLLDELEQGEPTAKDEEGVSDQQIVRNDADVKAMGDADSTTLESSERDPVIKAAVDAASKARNDYHEAEQKFKEIELELEKYEQIVSGDFGEDSEFVTLRGECYELIEKEYIYKLCPFDRCSQKPKNGGSETSLGRWVRWESREGNRYASLKFEGGTGCWNGPSRSTIVLLQCGLSNEIVSATEPSRCEYQLEFATPAACTTGMSVSPGHSVPDEHDEL